MQLRLGAALIAAMALAGCASPPAANADRQAVASGDQAKKKCDAMTGSRMGNCRDAGAPEVQAVGGDDYRRDATTLSTANPRPPH